MIKSKSKQNLNRKKGGFETLGKTKFWKKRYYNYPELYYSREIIFVILFYLKIIVVDLIS